MEFRTKIDFSSNRQVKQFPETIMVLSGATSFGVPFNQLPSGPDYDTEVVTASATTLYSNFTGTSATTVYNWANSSMSLGNAEFSAITPSNSAETQSSGSIFVSAASTVIDGNTVNLSYTGVSFDITPISFVELAPNSYSGTVLTNILLFLSTDALDFTGRTIWNDVSGITRTERLILTDNASVGNVLVCSDNEGLYTSSPSTHSTYRLTGTTAFTYTNSINSLVVNTSSATTVNLIANPTVNTVLVIKVRHNAALYNVTVNGNGKLIDGSSSITITTQNASYIFLYDGVEYVII